MSIEQRYFKAAERVSILVASARIAEQDLILVQRMLTFPGEKDTARQLLGALEKRLDYLNLGDGS